MSALAPSFFPRAPAGPAARGRWEVSKEEVGSAEVFFSTVESQNQKNTPLSPVSVLASPPSRQTRVPLSPSFHTLPHVTMHALKAMPTSVRVCGRPAPCRAPLRCGRRCVERDTGWCVFVALLLPTSPPSAPAHTRTRNGAAVVRRDGEQWRGGGDLFFFCQLRAPKNRRLYPHPLSPASSPPPPPSAPSTQITPPSSSPAAAASPYPWPAASKTRARGCGCCSASTCAAPRSKA